MDQSVQDRLPHGKIRSTRNATEPRNRLRLLRRRQALDKAHPSGDTLEAAILSIFGNYRPGSAWCYLLTVSSGGAVPVIGRLLIGLPFAMSGVSKLAAYAATTAIIVSAGLPVPPLAFLVAVAVELGGGMLLLLGYRVRPAAIAMAVFALVIAVVFHKKLRGSKPDACRLRAGGFR